MSNRHTEFFKRYHAIMAPTTVDPVLGIVATRDEGLHIWDCEGNRYADWDSSVATLPLGHKHPVIVEGLIQTLLHGVQACEATARPPCFSITVQNREYEISPVILGEMLKKHVFPDDNAHVFLDVTGALAVDDAVMFALRQRPERTRALAFIGAFHGRHGFARDFTCSKQEQKLHYPHSGITTTHLPFPKNDETFTVVEDMLQRIPLDDVNCVVVEAVQGEGGIEVWNTRYWKRLQTIFKDANIFIVADEIQCGMGRTGKMWGYQHIDMHPDIVLAGKGLGSGLPISALLWKQSMENRPLELSWNSGTFPGYPLGLTAAILTLDIIEREGLCERAETLGKYLETRLDFAITQYYHGDSATYCMRKGLGFMQGIEFLNESEKSLATNLRNHVLSQLKRRGILTLGCGHPDINPTIRFLPPLTIQKKDIDELAEALYDILPA